MNLSSIDLNLLLVFDAVMTERNATRAGLKVGMSQPAVSNALNRLRHVLKDDLFVRGADGMRPTARAFELELPVRRALAGIEEALEPVSFDPATDERTFTIASTDYIAMTLLPYLTEYISEEAPGINIHITPVAGRLYEKLDHQEADYGLTAMSEVAERFGSLAIGSDHFVCLMRKDHPLAKYRESIPVEEYAAARHLLVSPKGDAHGFVDERLMELGMKRRIVSMVNGFGPAPLVVSSSDLIVTLPSRVAEKCADHFDLHVVPSPISPSEHMTGMVLLWHKRFANHPAHVWFQSLVTRAGNDLELHGVRIPVPKVTLP